MTAEPASEGTGASKTPADFLKAIKGQRVIVKLNSGVDYKGEAARGCAGLPVRFKALHAQAGPGLIRHAPASRPAHTASQECWRAWMGS